MILPLWRAVLLAGGSWLVAKQAFAADVAFTTYAFPATATPTSITLPDRLAQIKNVKDFGATGNGVTDDLAAIQAAFDWTVGASRGCLYFPPGTYYVSGPIDISTTSTTVYILGSMGASTLVGNFADYVIKRYFLGPDLGGSGHVIEKLTIINSNALGGGIRIGGCVGAAVRDCDITANFGIDTDNSDVFGPPGGPGAYWYSVEVSIENCHMRAYTALATGSTGMARGGNGPTSNCTFKNFDTALRTYGGQGAHNYFGCYFEGNNIAIANSTPPYPGALHGTGGSTGGLAFVGCHFKNNGIAIDFVAGITRYSGLFIEALEGTIPGDPQYGITVEGGGSCAFEGISITGQYAVAGVQMTGGESVSSPSAWMGVGVTNTSMAGGAVAWDLPSTAKSMNIIECNVASVWTMAELPAKTYTLATATWSGGTASITVVGGSGDLPTGQNLNVTISGVTPSGYNGFFFATVTNFNAFTYTVADPGGPGTVMGTAFETAASNQGANAVEGVTYNVSNADTATWGAAAVSTGSNHCKLRFTPAAWTVMGK